MGGDAEAGAGEGGAGGAPASGPLGDEAAVKVWALAASAPAVFLHLYEPLAFTDGVHTFPDPSCPEVNEDGDVTTISGGCSDAIGDTWVGSATIERGEDGERTITFDGYGHAFDMPEPPMLTGTAVVTELDDGTHDFEVELTHQGEVTTVYDYTGNVEGSYDGATVWNGTGQIERQGATDPIGTITATTVAEVLDSTLCTGEPVSGSTTLEADGQLAVITYDGAADCGGDAEARWSLDGEDRGTLSGIVCSVAHVGRSARGGGAFELLLLLGGCLVFRRARWSRFTN